MEQQIDAGKPLWCVRRLYRSLAQVLKGGMVLLPAPAQPPSWMQVSQYFSKPSTVRVNQNAKNTSLQVGPNRQRLGNLF